MGTGNMVNLSELLDYALKVKATDLHITAGSPPIVRINSLISAVEGCEPATSSDTEAFLKSFVSEEHWKLLEENGEVDFSFSRSGIGRYRANVYRQRGSYSAAIRALPYSIPTFDTLGLPQSVRQLALKKNGLVLVTGATGSGKSTTLASLVDIINSERQCHIMTIEDPIEYLHRHKKSIVNQREIGWDSRSFSTALRAALREDPDVILVGEMRDTETIDIALTAAETGHLVLSTLHTTGAAKSVNRILDSFPREQRDQVSAQLAAVLEGVVSQQLIPKADGSGIVPAAEVMIVNFAIRNLIREGKPHQINTMLQTGAEAGMQTMDASLADLCNHGLIAYNEALSRCQEQQAFQRLCSRMF